MEAAAREVATAAVGVRDDGGDGSGGEGPGPGGMQRVLQFLAHRQVVQALEHSSSLPTWSGIMPL